MTDARWNELMDSNNLEAMLGDDELTEGWHWCADFDGLLRNKDEEDYKCSCDLRPFYEH